MTTKHAPLAALAAAMLMACSSGGSDASAPEVVVSEVFYKGKADDSLEWIEIRNIGDEPVPLSGLKIKGGVSWSFPDSSSDLAPGAFAVVTNDLTGMASVHPEVSAYGPWDGKLKAEGEEIRLEFDEETLWEGRIESGPAWPAMADGGGFSLVRVEGGDPENHTGWGAGTVLGGNPGVADSAASAAVVLVNEVLPAGALPGAWVELYNASDAAVDLSGWWVAEDPGTSDPMVLPSGTTIAAGGYLLLMESFTDGAILWGANFFPSVTGDRVVLIQVAGGIPTGSASSLRWSAVSEGSSVGLVSVWDGSFVARTLDAPTPGAANGAESVGSVVISEIFYNPGDAGTGFLEILNRGADTVTLADAFDTEKRWKIDGLSVDFPAGCTLLPGARLLVLEDDADTALFRSQYGVPSAVQVYASSSKLDNGGETLRLMYPLYPLASGEWEESVEDIVPYDDKTPWPQEADGGGKSLQRVDVTLAGSDPVNWVAGDPTPGK